MESNPIKTRIIHKHDTEEHWELATNFIPKKGEIIVYDKDPTYNYERFKIGDGELTVNNLPFADDNKVNRAEYESTTTALQASINEKLPLAGGVLTGVPHLANNERYPYISFLPSSKADSPAPYAKIQLDANPTNSKNKMDFVIYRRDPESFEKTQFYESYSLPYADPGLEEYGYYNIITSKGGTMDGTLQIGRDSNTESAPNLRLMRSVNSVKKTGTVYLHSSDGSFITQLSDGGTVANYLKLHSDKTVLLKPLTIESGGTGANTLEGAKISLGITDLNETITGLNTKINITAGSESIPIYFKDGVPTPTKHIMLGGSTDTTQRLFEIKRKNSETAEYGKLAMNVTSSAGSGFLGFTHYGSTGTQDFETSIYLSQDKIQPTTDSAIDLGATGKKWKSIYANSFIGRGDNLTNLKASNITDGTLAIEQGGTGANSRYEAVNNIFAHPHNPIDSVTNDTPSNWGTTIGTGFSHFWERRLNNQPTDYGNVLTLSPAWSQDVTQIWQELPNGTMYIRGGNSSGWHEWKKVFDNTQIIPIENGGTGATTVNDALINLKAFRKLDNNVINSTANDTVSNWGTIDSGYSYYNTNGCLNGQPTRYGFLIHFKVDSERFQFWRAQPSGATYWRSGNSDGWSTWAKVYDTSYKPTAADVGALSINGGSLNGDLTIGGNGMLYLTPSGNNAYEGGEIRLNSPADNQTMASLVIDNYTGKLRIWGNGSKDGTTHTGIGQTLTISPYDGTITGGYTITGTLNGTASKATQLANSRTIFGRSFNGTDNVAGKGTFNGTYNATAANRFNFAALEIRENGLVGNAQTDIGYAPQIGFHWLNTCAGTIALHQAKFKFLTQAGNTATIVANIEGEAISIARANTENTSIGVTNNNGSIGLCCHSSRGLYDNGNSKWVLSSAPGSASWTFYGNATTATNVTGTVAIENGGTGVTSLTALKNILGSNVVASTTQPSNPVDGMIWLQLEG